MIGLFHLWLAFSKWHIPCLSPTELDFYRRLFLTNSNCTTFLVSHKIFFSFYMLFLLISRFAYLWPRPDSQRRDTPLRHVRFELEAKSQRSRRPTTIDVHEHVQDEAKEMRILKYTNYFSFISDYIQNSISGICFLISIKIYVFLFYGIPSNFDIKLMVLSVVGRFRLPSYRQIYIHR